MLKLAIIGNCQAEMLQQFVKEMSDEVIISILDGVHKLSHLQKEKYIKVYTEVNYIITHNISDNYPIEYVRTSFLQESFPGKIFVMANFWFNGYDPSIFVPLARSGLPLEGPLGGNHSRSIIKSFEAGLSADQALMDWQNMKDFEARAIQMTNESISVMVERDESCQLKGSDFMITNFQNIAISHTVNHPSSSYILHLAEQLFSLFKIKNEMLNINSLPDYFLLNFIDIIPNKFIYNHFKLEFKKATLYRGYANQSGSWQGVKLYTSRDLVQVFYSIYSSVWSEEGASLLQNIM